jgi:hypothetical protein
VAGGTVSRYFDWSLMVGALGLVGPPLAFFVANIVGAMFVSAIVFFVWFAMLVWSWYDYGARALPLLLPSLLMVLIWPGAYAAVAVACSYYYPCL